MNISSRYKTVKELNKGVHSSTFLAISTETSQQCVLKVFECADANLIPYFQKEVDVLKAIGNHPYIPELLDFSVEEGNVYIIREFIDGHPLSHELSNNIKFQDSYAIKLIADILGVLSFVHEKKVVHADITPDNLIRRKSDGAIFLVDFGAAKRIGTSEINEEGVLHTELALGTEAYMAPEQRIMQQPLMASDLYALGLILVEVLTRESNRRFPLDYERDTLDWRKYGNRLPATTFKDNELSPHDGLADFIDRLLKQIPEDRFDNALQASRAFEEVRLSCDPQRKTDVVSPGTVSFQESLLNSTFQRQQDRCSTTELKGNYLGRKIALSKRQLSMALACPFLGLLLVGGGVKSGQWMRHQVSSVSADWNQQKNPYPQIPEKRLANLLEDGTIQLHSDAIEAFWEMAKMAEIEGITLYPLSGYSPLKAYKAQLTHSETDKVVQSEKIKTYDYHTGYALDISDYSLPGEVDRSTNFAETDAYDWLIRNARTYGFELSSSGRISLHLKDEPWHWRYVGNDDSAAIFKSED